MQRALRVRQASHALEARLATGGAEEVEGSGEGAWLVLGLAAPILRPVIS